MATAVVQFREDVELIESLKAQGVNPNELARDAFRAAVRRRSAERTMEELDKVQARFSRPIEDIIREMRDSR